MAAGDERALGELYDRHGSTVYALARAIVGERADTEEVVADAFGQAWRTAGQFDPARGSVTAWLATITRTRSLGELPEAQRRVIELAYFGGQTPSRCKPSVTRRQRRWRWESPGLGGRRYWPRPRSRRT